MHTNKSRAVSITTTIRFIISHKETSAANETGNTCVELGIIILFTCVDYNMLYNCVGRCEVKAMQSMRPMFRARVVFSLSHDTVSDVCYELAHN